SHDHRVIKLGDTRDTSDPSVIHWRTSSFSGNNGTCVEVAALPRMYAIALFRRRRDLFTRAEMNRWLNSTKTGEFDNPTL
ncbi:MAG TPA: DUF397 domain-containing protein, partial [Pseudonocardiaceae bacterium]|nr:DUF397 domain-containing protein [Pseudonocardiaceae bacterium]